MVAVDGTHTPEHTHTLRQVGAGGAHTPGGAVMLLFGAACGTHSTGEGEEPSAPLVGAGGMLVAADGTCTLEHSLTLLQFGAGGEHTPEGTVIVLPGAACGILSTGGGSTVPSRRGGTHTPGTKSATTAGAARGHFMYPGDSLVARCNDERSFRSKRNFPSNK